MAIVNILKYLPFSPFTYIENSGLKLADLPLHGDGVFLLAKEPNVP
jgi:hypothetical protein